MHDVNSQRRIIFPIIVTIGYEGNRSYRLKSVIILVELFYIASVNKG